jgi:hypothetical protein
MFITNTNFPPKYFASDLVESEAAGPSDTGGLAESTHSKAVFVCFEVKVSQRSISLLWN